MAKLMTAQEYYMQQYGNPWASGNSSAIQSYQYEQEIGRLRQYIANLEMSRTMYTNPVLIKEQGYSSPALTTTNKKLLLIK